MFLLLLSTCLTGYSIIVHLLQLPQQLGPVVLSIGIPVTAVLGLEQEAVLVLDIVIGSSKKRMHQLGSDLGKLCYRPSGDRLGLCPVLRSDTYCNNIITRS